MSPEQLCQQIVSSSEPQTALIASLAIVKALYPAYLSTKGKEETSRLRACADVLATAIEVSADVLSPGSKFAGASAIGGYIGWFVPEENQ